MSERLLKTEMCLQGVGASEDGFMLFGVPCELPLFRASGSAVRELSPSLSRNFSGSASKRTLQTTNPMGGFP